MQFAALLSDFEVNRQRSFDCAQKRQLLVEGLVYASNCAKSMSDCASQVLDLQVFAICIIPKLSALKMVRDRAISARDLQNSNQTRAVLQF
jgi:hypothetical protein